MAVVGCGIMGRAQGREQASLDFRLLLLLKYCSLLGPWGMQEMSLLFWDWNLWLPVSEVNHGCQVLGDLILSPQFILGQEGPLAVPQSTGLCRFSDLEFSHHHFSLSAVVIWGGAGHTALLLTESQDEELTLTWRPCISVTNPFCRTPGYSKPKVPGRSKGPIILFWAKWLYLKAKDGILNPSPCDGLIW